MPGVVCHPGFHPSWLWWVAVGESIVGVIFGLIWGYVRSLDRFFTELYNLIDNVPYIIYMTLIALMVGRASGSWPSP